MVSINDVAEIDKEVMKKLDLVSEMGNPDIDMSLFEQEPVITDNINFKVIRHERKIYIICDNERMDKKLAMENLDILLDSENNIVGYIFSGFTAGEWSEINESIDSSIRTATEYKKD